MNGIDWRTIGNPTFERIVDTLLSIEFGSRGRPIEGRGGEGEIPGDFSADDGKIVFEYKYFPDGFPSSGSRPKQIKTSFAKARKRNPEDWILVVPAKLTYWEQKFMTQLAGDSGIKVTYRDRVWLDTQLALQPNLANYFRFHSDNDYLQQKAEQFKHNPLIKNARDLAERVGILMASAADADPDWTWDISTKDGDVLHTLKAQHANAALLSPVKMSFESLIPAGSEEAKELQEADAFGYCKPITIPGDLVKDFKITGPPLVAWEGDIAELKLLPSEPGEWIDADLTLLDSSGELLGIHLAQVHSAGHGRAGFTFEVALGSLLGMTFRAPYQAGVGGRADFRFADAAGVAIRDVFEATDFVCQLAAASRLQIKSAGAQLALMEVEGQLGYGGWVTDYHQVRGIAEDLLKIEAETKVKFRYPDQIDAEERVMIRNLRLMLEGHCVAHPTWTSVTAELSGERDEGLEALLTTDPKWLLRTNDTATLTLLGQNVNLKQLGLAGLFTLDPDQLLDIEDAFVKGTAPGKKIYFRCRKGDRIRMFLGDRFDQNQPIEITPWEVDGINQKGLTADGRPL